MSNQNPCINLQQIVRFPVKSVSGESLNNVTVLPTGLEYDRHWMLVDDLGKFLSQRKHPKMALLRSRIEHGTLLLKIPDVAELKIATSSKQSWRDVTIWNDQLPALEVSEADHLLQDFLQTSCHLVEMSQQQPRKITDPAADGIVSFADGFPFLLIGTASLDALNEKLVKSVTMDNFRPNIVVNTIESHQEDSWDELKIGEVIFKNVKPCSRCIMTTIDPATALAATDQEPLSTLAKYRKIPKVGIIFGCNLIALNRGTINRGDKVEILSYIRPDEK